MLIRSLAVAAMAFTMAAPIDSAEAHRRHHGHSHGGHYGHSGLSFGFGYRAPLYPRYRYYRRAPAYYYPAVPVYRQPYYRQPGYAPPPVAAQPAPTYVPAQPAQTYAPVTQPAPTYAPVQSAPVQAAPDTSNYINIGPLDQSNQVQPAPAQPYVPPAQTYSAPVQTYAAPAQTYTQPAQTYTEPTIQVIPADDPSLSPYQPTQTYGTQPQGNYATNPIY